MMRKRKVLFKDELYEIRRTQNLTQKEMARKLVIPYRTYQAWEAGYRLPPKYTQEVIKILAAE